MQPLPATFSVVVGMALVNNPKQPVALSESLPHAKFPLAAGNVA
jgi:hypothetical protein